MITELALANAEIICADALVWARHNGSAGPVVTSLPDADEIGLELGPWRAWFARAATACFAIAGPAMPVVFFQTDRKQGGATHSKAKLTMDAAASLGARLLWHKIVLRRAPGRVDLHRPGYSHLLAFSVTANPGAATPDVLENGPSLYRNGMGRTAANFAVRFAGNYGPRIVDPFCGRGTVNTAAVAAGLETVGVDIDPAQCEAARRNLGLGQ